jgi:CRISPR/Cas system-associated exonuclease Cas4 (RecB family)
MIQADKFNNLSRKYEHQANAEYLMYIDTLQEFSVQLSFISSLTSAGKLSVQESHSRVQQLWEILSASKEQLECGILPGDANSSN